MSEQADIEAALARATAAYKNVSAERDALKDAADRAEAAEAERDRLREALKEAREDVAHWGGYASDYFREKHDLAGDLARIDAALAKEAGPVLRNDGWDQYRDEAGNPAFDGYDKEAGK